MTTIDRTAECVETAQLRLHISAFVKRCWSALQERRRRARLRDALYAMPDRDLRDIGISWSEVEYLALNGTVERGPRKRSLGDTTRRHCGTTGGMQHWRSGDAPNRPDKQIRIAQIAGSGIPRALVQHIASFALALALQGVVLGTTAEAHSWYPKECCSNHDCISADAIVPDERGGKIVIVRQTRIPIPEGFAARASPDGRIHICFVTTTGELYGDPNFLPLCLFLPAES